MESDNLPKSLQEAIRYFTDPAVCLKFVANLRWPNGPVCPRCGGEEASVLSTRRVWKCKSCKKQFSLKVGTIFEDSPLGLDKWLAAIWMTANCKDGVSSYEVHRALGITQKTAWFLLHRIRLAMHTRTFDKMAGDVDAGETYVGGKVRSMDKEKRARLMKGRGTAGKTAVIGLLERHSGTRFFQVRSSVFDKRRNLKNYAEINFQGRRGRHAVCLSLRH